MKNMKVVLLVVLSVLTLAVSAQKGQEALDKL
ncbi:MAG: hypothetical protein ACI9G9_001153, partial [Psychromonas sp.]